jgi:hypothetical protein
MITKISRQGESKGVGEPKSVCHGRVVVAGLCPPSPRKKNIACSPGKRLDEIAVDNQTTMRFCFAAKFTEFPRNVTATEGQNVEMSCAFQSGSASVYLEIQWWFLRGPEDLEPGAEAAGAQVVESPSPQSPCLSLTHSPVPCVSNQGPRPQMLPAHPRGDPPGFWGVSDPQRYKGARLDLSW